MAIFLFFNFRVCPFATQRVTNGRRLVPVVVGEFTECFDLRMQFLAVVRLAGDARGSLLADVASEADTVGIKLLIGVLESGNLLELRSWLEWLSASTNARSLAMGS